MPFQNGADFLVFSAEVKSHRRFKISERSKAFIDSVEETVKDHQTEISTGTTLYRAQLGAKYDAAQSTDFNDLISFVETVRPFPPERMKPLRYSAKEGRVNPKGIPCLYLADDADTAMSEVRPWRGAYVSLGTFKTTRHLKVVDCTKKRPGYPWVNLTDKLETPELTESENWFQIANAFAVPITEAGDKAQYTPTQILAEVFKSLGFDGIKYQSLLTDGECGFSYALFNLEDADLVDCKLCQVKSITHEFSEPGSLSAVFTPSMLFIPLY